MRKIRITTDGKSLNSKPIVEEEKLEWSKRLGGSPYLELGLKDLADIVGNQRVSFNHGTYRNNWVNSANFEGSDLIVLDFDGNLSLPILFDRCNDHGLPPPNIIYRTMSDPACSCIDTTLKWQLISRYRAIWLLSKRIISISDFNILLKDGMYQIFPEADHVPAVQHWMGGKELVHLSDDTVLTPESLLAYIDTQDCISREINTDTGFRKRIRKNRRDSPVSFFDEAIYNKPLIRNFDWEQARDKFPLLDKFLNSQEKIYNPQLLGLYSGMRRIEGGRKKFIKAIKDNPNINDRHLDIVKWFDSQIIKGRSPWEQVILEYGPNDPAALTYERLTDIQFKRGDKACKYDITPQITLKEAEKKLKETFQSFMKDNSKRIWLVKAATALGKTELIIQHLDAGCIAVFPAHKLKAEVAERIRSSDLHVNVTPELPELPPRIKSEYGNIMKSKHPYRGVIFLRNIVHNHDISMFGLTPEEESDLRKRLGQYFKELDECINSDAPLLTTHARYIHTDFPKHHTVFIDEDILPTLMPTGKFILSKLLDLARELWLKESPDSDMDGDVMKKIYEKLKNNGEQKIPRQLDSPYLFEINDVEGLTNSIISLNKDKEIQILPFLDCDYYCVECNERNEPPDQLEVHYINKHPFPEKKTIVLSASASLEIYHHAFGEVEYVDISQVEHTGNLYQFSNYSFSRSVINSEVYGDNIQLINDHLSGIPLITYGSNRNLFPDNDTQLYFGNCAGYDIYKGQDLAVIGTTNLPEVTYRLYVAALGIKFEETDLEFKYQQVKHNGYRFNCTTYAHEELRNVQFYFVEGELIQAVGRNRSLREDVNTYLFSNYPLIGFEQHFTHELPKLVFNSNLTIHENSNLIPKENDRLVFKLDPFFSNLLNNRA